MSRLAIIENPYNAETPMDRLDGAEVPESDFFVRSHFGVPAFAPGAWRCAVGGAIARPMSYDLDDLKGLRRRKASVTLECAGNGRTLFRPAVKGAPWHLGAVGTAEFEGVALADVLDRAGLHPDVVEILFRGADAGEVAERRNVRFERSLPIEVACHPETLLAFGMNGEPLSPEHGAPVRLVVPRWYAVASVKWFVGIEALTEPFQGWFQGENYVYSDASVDSMRGPVTRMRVRTAVARPVDGAVVSRGPIEFAGSAWSGHGPIARVQLSLDGGVRWTDAHLGKPLSALAATPWRGCVVPSAAGALEVLARATDAAGSVQPMDSPWNRLGYGNNAVQRVRLTVV